jgi:hypothetical protein
MEKHFRWNFPDLFTRELRIPYKPWPASEIERHLCKTIVHWQNKAVTFYAFLPAQSPEYRIAKRKSHIFDSMVLVNMKITVCLYGQVDVAMAGYLLEHVIKEANPGIYFAVARSVEIEFD